MVQLGHYLGLAALIFGVGAIGFITRTNLLIQLMSIELMLNSVNLVFVALNRWMPQNHNGQLFSFFIIAVAAAEAAVGLAIVISLYRLRKTVQSDEIDALKN